MLSYAQIKLEASKPEKERQKILTSKGIRRKPRRYHMTDEKAKELRKVFKETGVFQNPYKKRGVSYAIVQSLIELGIDKKHSFLDVKKKIKEIMSGINDKNGNRTLWDVFVNKQPINRITGKDINGRIISNFILLQRLSGLHVYGFKLRQLYTCINIYCPDEYGLPLIKLNTQFNNEDEVKPINEFVKT